MASVERTTWLLISQSTSCRYVPVNKTSHKQVLIHIVTFDQISSHTLSRLNKSKMFYIFWLSATIPSGGVYLFISSQTEFAETRLYSKIL